MVLYFAGGIFIAPNFAPNFVELMLDTTCITG